MSYNKLYQQQVKKLAQRRGVRESAQSEPAFGFGFFRALALYQARNIGWTLLFLSVHVLEVLVLAGVHYIYFPPVSLQILRILSALGMAAIVAAVALRVSLPRLQHSSNGYKQDYCQLLLLIARYFFVAGVAVSALLLAFVAFQTKLHLTTPPIYRAVIISGILSFPFEILLTFLLYQRTQFHKAPPTLTFRTWMLLAFLTSLLFVALAWPLAYLIVALAPRIYYAMRLWGWAANGSGITLFGKNKLGAQALAIRGLARKFLIDLSKPLALLAAIEFSLLYTLRPITKGDPNIALLFFFVHKTLHIAQVLSTRFLLRFASALRDAYALNHSARSIELHRKLRAASILSLIVACICLPLILLQRQALFWYSASGEEFPLEPILIFTLLAWIAFHVFTTQKILLTSLANCRWKQVAFQCSLIATPALISSIYGQEFRSYTDLRFLLPIFVAIEVFPQVLICFQKVRLNNSLTRTSDVQYQISFSAFLKDLADKRTTHAALWVQLDPSSSARYAVEHYQLTFPFCYWGQHNLLLLVPSNLIAHNSIELKSKILQMWGVVINSIVAIPAESMLSSHLAEFPSRKGSIECQLFELALDQDYSNRAISLTARSQFNKILLAINKWHATGEAPAKSDGFYFSLIDKHGQHHSQAMPFEQEVLHNKFAKYLLQSGDLLDPSHWQLQSFKGMFHLNSGSELMAIISLDAAEREILFDLKQFAFAHNFSNLKSTLSQGSNDNTDSLLALAESA